jgi:Flp pilus assembly protein TadD
MIRAVVDTERPMTAVLFRTFACAAALLLAAPAGAADVVATPSKPDVLAAARAHIAEKNWQAAIDELKKVNLTASADWNNLMGYSLRKADPANAADAEKFYDAALAIEPKHRGALEYSGELYLMNGRLDLAEQRLAALDKACFLPCEEYRDLKRAVNRYKAAGNKFVAQ